MCIRDSLKRVDFEDSEIRQLLPGLPYTLPPKPNKPDFLATSAAAMVLSLIHISVHGWRAAVAARLFLHVICGKARCKKPAQPAPPGRIRFSSALVPA